TLNAAGILLLFVFAFSKCCSGDQEECEDQPGRSHGQLIPPRITPPLRNRTCCCPVTSAVRTRWVAGSRTRTVSPIAAFLSASTRSWILIPSLSNTRSVGRRGRTKAGEVVVLAT